MNQITVKNNNIELTVLDFGAIIQKLIIKDKNGNPTNVVVGYENSEDYLVDDMFLGACIGRYAGRITNGEFSLNNENYKLHQDKSVHLHGGLKGFNQKYFKIEKIDHSKQPSIQLSYLSRDLEEGYPGTLKVLVTYTLLENSLKITHEATTDKTTVVNLTNHSYFKLDDAEEVNDYRLQLNCSKITETHDNLLPNGNFLNVENSKYDFTKEKYIGETRLDTPFAIDKGSDISAIVKSKKSGITMKVKTNQPALIVYTPPKTGSICFETQNFPDAPNQENFPSSTLRPGEVYKNESFFTFN
ncbi:galactose mutarotase [Cellulophaga sp. HaHaR_3_176]|uniref:aldose epimerase family protein n=1 Tax=Cellulophaga sp. HaHaR_3_176 TaxID=1942464 RepID=UPI001C1FF28D|nr:aldose epimerase family protein [Cellulophaga sp. HaHaR_3_176]QWX84564.1 galactose mutarotase [Cellulophaga sp. HaHaR_3_176]